MTDAPQFDPAHADLSALTEPISAAEVRTFHAAVRADRRADPAISTGFVTAASILSVVGIGFVIVVFVVVFASTLLDRFVDGSAGRSLWFLLFFLVFFGVIAFAVLRNLFGSGGRWRGWLRLTRLAAANGLRFRNLSPKPNYPGCIFVVGDARAATDSFSTESGRFVNFGNYRYSTGSGKSRSTHYWGFLALQLDRNLPNMVLDSKSNNGLFGTTDLPASFRRDQVLSLEGDFDRSFTLYCPKEYEQDALYVFTPDLMALLVDDAASFDVEIVDNWLFVYSARPFDLLSPSVYERLFRIVATVGTKAVSQTTRYADDRVGVPGANIIAPGGQRLRHGASLGSVVVFAIFGGVWLWSMFHGQA